MLEHARNENAETSPAQRPSGMIVVCHVGHPFWGKSVELRKLKVPGYILAPNLMLVLHPQPHGGNSVTHTQQRSLKPCI
jgi:hypothetical protein